MMMDPRRGKIAGCGVPPPDQPGAHHRRCWERVGEGIFARNREGKCLQMLDPIMP